MLTTQCLEKCNTDFCNTYVNGALRDRDECFTRSEFKVTVE